MSSIAASWATRRGEPRADPQRQAREPVSLLEQYTALEE